MYGYLTLRSGRRKTELRSDELCGLPVLRAEVGIPKTQKQNRLERRVYRAAVRLWERGVSHVLTPTDFPYWPALKKAGLAPVETEELCRVAAAPLTTAALAMYGWEPGRAVVVLAGRRVSRPMLRTAETLARQVCRLVVDVPEGGGALAGYLHEEYGVPVLLPGTVRPAITVAFDASRVCDGPVLKLWGEKPDLLGVELWVPGVDVPEGCETLPLLAALRECGRIADGALLAKPLDIPKQSTYNTKIISGTLL